MSLEVIGAGFGRTGTESLKAALEILGYGRCDHMLELVRSTWRVEHLEALHRKQPANLEALFDGFRSAVDFPYAMYYRELMAAYPEAKLVLTVRDKDAWYESARRTIFRGLPPGALTVARVLGLVSKNARGIPRWWAYLQEALFQGFFEGRMDDRAFMTGLFERWNEEVQRTVPPEKLLVYSVGEGWEPLCNFLNVPVPDQPFPRSNDSDSFQRRTKLGNLGKMFLGTKKA